MLVALGSVPGGCATFACDPVAIVVAEKDERVRLESRVRGVRVDPLGRVREDREEVIVREYWVRDPEGRWYRVDAERWRAVAAGGTVEVCR